MTLAIGDTAPDFEAQTTEGPIRFHDWIGDSWAVLFSHPKDFTPVCTTELGYMAKIKPEFERRGVKIVGLSVDSTGDHEQWARDIEETQGTAPNYPIIADADFNVAKLYGMLPASTSGDAKSRKPADNQTVRNVFVVGPDKKIKLILIYPMTTGRNFDEVLRVIDSLQLTAKHRVATPVNWKNGEDVIIAGSVSDDEAKTIWPDGWKSPKPYIRVVRSRRDGRVGVIFSQHYLGCLSHASYLVGDETTGRVVVVDPRRDVDVYLEEAAANGLTIERVIETHIHADFLSGHLELAVQTGAAISYGAGADVEFEIDPVHDGQRLQLGDVTLEILATPGHTPESICIVIYEHANDTEPYGVLTGDTLFVGDVGRPDLLASAGSDLLADVLGRQLYRSLHDKLLRLPDSTRVFPAHGAGSSCGKQLSSETSSTLGEQRRTNYALQPMSEDEFVAVVTEGQPTRPAYFKLDAQRNREVHPLLDSTAPASLDIDDVLRLSHRGAVLLDAREPADFAAGHLRGAVNAGLQGRFAEWCGDVLAPDRDVVLVGDPALAAEAKVRLARVGFDRVIGQLADPANLFAGRPELIETSSRLTIEQLAELRGLEPDLQLVDVRGPGETATGTLPGAREIPLPALIDSLAALDPSAPVVTYCGSGYRSQIAASVLVARGFADVSDLLGGVRAWTAAGLPTSTGASTAAGASTPAVGPKAAFALVESGALLLDVREPDEWRMQHAASAVPLPMGQVRQRQDELPRDRQIVAVCRSGGRSAAVTESLRAWGFDAVNLAGGMCAWAAAGLPTVGPTDDGLVVHREHPINCETSIPALIGGVVMPNARFYVRNHFETPSLDATQWRLAVSGLVDHPLRLSLRDVQNMRSHTLVATLECAGNGRSMFVPRVEGEQWQFGAVSTAEWTGVPLLDVLDNAAPTSDARAILFRGADSGVIDPARPPIPFERGLSLDEASRSEALLAYAMNGDPLPAEHGYPLRLIVPGWYAVASVKWLTDIELIASPLDAYFQTERYVFEWERDGDTLTEPVRLQRVRSLITSPANGDEIEPGTLTVRGVAWSGAAAIAGVDVRVGDGPWQPAELIGDRRRHSWQRWELLTHLTARGATTVRSRATDLEGRVQPAQPEWNRLGYGANAIQVVPIMVSPPAS